MAVAIYIYTNNIAFDKLDIPGQTLFKNTFKNINSSKYLASVNPNSVKDYLSKPDALIKHYNMVLKKIADTPDYFIWIRNKFINKLLTGKTTFKDISDILYHPAEIDGYKEFKTLYERITSRFYTS